jgi:hypothetical protein
MHITFSTSVSYSPSLYTYAFQLQNDPATHALSLDYTYSAVSHI